jgi:hypothetical protein
MLKLIHGLASTLLAATLLAGVSSAAAVLVPMKGKATGALTSFVPGHLSFAATGTATHVGRYEEIGEADFDALGNVSNGHFTYASIDGATLEGVFSGTFAPLPTGQIQFVVTATYVLGTGRLAGVTGQAEIVALADGVGAGAPIRYVGRGSLAIP